MKITKIAFLALTLAFFSNARELRDYSIRKEADDDKKEAEPKSMWSYSYSWSYEYDYEWEYEYEVPEWSTK